MHQSVLYLAWPIPFNGCHALPACIRDRKWQHNRPKSLRAMKAPEDAAVVPELEIGEPALRLESRQEEPEQGIVIDVSPPLSSFHYQVKNVSKPYNYKSTQG